MDRDLRSIGAVCAILTTIAFVVGIVLMATSGVEALIPDTGDAVLDWVDQVDSAGGVFYAGGWLVVLGGILGLVALIGFYDALKSAGQALVIAPVLAIASLTLVTISHVTPIAMAYELVPGYLAADEAGKASLEVVLNTLASVCLVLNYTGDIVLWGVVVPMYAVAGLATHIVPRWIGWLGLVTAALAGWLGVLSPSSAVIEGIASIGFLTFFVWIASMGVALLRTSSSAAPVR